MADLQQNYREFLENPYYIVATTLRSDGSPHNTVVWVDVDDDGVSINTTAGGAKARHVRDDPRMAIMVVNPQNGYHWLSINGRGELTTDGADAQIDRLSKKYLGQYPYPYRRPGEERVSIRIHADRIEGYGFKG